MLWQEKKIPIVVCMIVKNEESLLARCLESVKWADKIYIADTGSTDRTVEIAKKYTPHVFTDYTWKDSFADARNHVLSKVEEQGAWVISIDADEFMQTPADMVKAAIAEAEEKKSLAINIMLVSEREGQVHAYPRLFKKCPEVWWEGVAHNSVSVKANVDSTVRIIYGYSPAHQKDPDRTVRILEKETQKPDCSPRNIYYLGREYWYRARYKDCLDTLLKYVDKAYFMAEKADAYLTIARCHYFMGQQDEARTACVHAIVINAHFREAVLFMSSLAGAGSGNPIWEGNAMQWARMAETATNNGVLFVR